MADQTAITVQENKPAPDWSNLQPAIRIYMITKMLTVFNLKL